MHSGTHISEQDLLSEIQQATLLQGSNSTLRTQISALSDNGRIVKLAEAYGMHNPSPLLR